MADLCVVCHRRDPAYGAVCVNDRDRLAAGIREVFRKTNAIRLQLVPSQRVKTGRIGGHHIDAPMPARLDVLSLTGPGNVAVTALLHPAVRRWTTSRTVAVTTVVAGRRRTEKREIVDWHCDLVTDEDGRTVLVPIDDQVGSIPPAEWLASWARAWYAHFGTTRVTGPADTAPPASAPRVWKAAAALDRVAAAAVPAGAAVLAWAGTVERAYRGYATRTVLGLNTPGDVTGDDPVVDEWLIRFGHPGTDRLATAAARYLLTWLDRACDADVGIADLAVELRTINAELTRVLGETPDQQWLGRCPATLTARARDANGQPRTVHRPCGASLWQDPHASQVMCPRCRSTWGPRVVELMHLATAIRMVWPIDRRRRYTTDEADAAPRPSCPTCGQPVFIDWRDVTGTGDVERWWRPARATCHFGCAEARETI